MTKYRESNITFVNPYHFVSLEEKCSRGFDYDEVKEKKDLLTGFVTCSLKTLTPVFIPNTTPDDPNTFKKYNNICSYDFFSYEDINGTIDPPAPKPVIPGSEIRGMIRSAFEAVTNSCLSTTDKDRLQYKRTTVPAKNCGLLRYDDGKSKWEIIKCNKLKINTNNYSNISGYKEGQLLYIKIQTKRIRKNNRTISLQKVLDIANKPKGDDYKEGWFHWGEYSENKKHESVFVKSPGENNRIFIEEIAVKKLLENLKLYANEKVNINLSEKNGHKGYEKILKKFNKRKMDDLILDDLKKLNNLPVYYTQYSGKTYLSPAAIGREVFDNNIHSILEANGGYQPCNNVKDLCPACVLMGLAGEKDNAAASRVRFTDALYKNGKNGNHANNDTFDHLYEPVSILPELASPKPSAVEFYLQKTASNADIWNYDYAFKWKRKPNGRLTNIPEPISYKPQLNGRKFYWHHRIEDLKKTALISNEKLDRNVAVRSLTKEVTFSFKVYFNDITKAELKKLLWVLEIGGIEQNAHKIGMGKPLGLGSVKVSIDRLDIRKIGFDKDSIVWDLKEDKDILKEVRNLSASYHNKKEKESKAKRSTPEESLEKMLGCSEKVLQEFLKITDFDNAPKNVMYPQNIDQQQKPIPESYKWFMGNRECKGTGTSPIIHQTLPSIEKPQLKKYIQTQ